MNQATNKRPPRGFRSLFYIWSYVRPYKGRVTLALGALLFTAGITLSIGQGVRLLIDEGLATSSPENLQLYVSIFLGLVLCLALGTFIRYYTVTWLGERVVADIRNLTFQHLISLHPGFFESNRSLEIQSRLTADTTVLQSVIGSSVSVALRNIIMLVGGLIWLFITNAKLTGIVLVSVPLIVGPILIYGRRVRKLSRESQDEVANVGSYVGETLNEIKTVQAYNHQETDVRRFGQQVEQAFEVARSRIWQRALLITVVIVLVLGAIGAMLWVGGMDVIHGRISGGELAAFVFYSIIVGSAVGSISEVISELQRAAGAMDRINELLSSESEIAAPPDGGNALPEPVQGNLALSQVRFSYPTRPDIEVLKGISLDIKPGETLALVGPSGAGKSTLFDLLLRFFDLNAGEITLEGQPISSLDPKALRTQFGIVAQNPALFFGTIKDNILYGKPEASEAEMLSAAKAAHAHEFISKLSLGYNTKVGDGGLGLSGGQKQRIAIARAILKNAPILLLDEATSALDAQSERFIQDTLTELMDHKTAIVIAHRLSTVKHADRIAVLDEGKIQAVGTHDELMAGNPLYANLAKLQFAEGST